MAKKNTHGDGIVGIVHKMQFKTQQLYEALKRHDQITLKLWKDRLFIRMGLVGEKGRERKRGKKVTVILGKEVTPCFAFRFHSFILCSRFEFLADGHRSTLFALLEFGEGGPRLFQKWELTSTKS